ncbi:hypothetical protein EDE15_4133 [Edaphobacter aggregans]|uniref:Uncharacterized protein n=1 Tax=Edaphobacter aggregans TaxID=570835 RepID=A0A428MNR1_9BACT|nr:hypothetical protein EDE15_4133 [Edaphobacter aggregans]
MIIAKNTKARTRSWTIGEILLWGGVRRLFSHDGAGDSEGTSHVGCRELHLKLYSGVPLIAGMYLPFEYLRSQSIRNK